ncbi:DUF7344 domain-containing protein [Halobaculum marinum]|uniref:DUF7344 domain-containing protein n=1 Tax=Halobaculum marinum TaxID=3031996 RepID=A0ABD5X112_9EURY|nr:hypothetical protein [Halobaculum sp. DT55]
MSQISILPQRESATTGPVVESSGKIDRDAMYSLLSSRRRRNVLHALVANDGTSTVSDLARRLAAWETGKPPEAVTSKERKRTYTALRQTHLPKLAEYDVVEYDVNRGTVALTEVGEELQPYLWPRRDIGEKYTRMALVAVLSGAVVTALSWLGVPPFALLDGYLLTATVTAAFGLVTIGMYLRTRPAVLSGSAHQSDTQYAARNDDGDGTGGDVNRLQDTD